MTILAVCGPIGSDFKAFSEQCYSLLNKENTLLIDSSTHNSIGSLLSAIEDAHGDVIVFGPDIFLDEKLRSKFDIKVFLELDSDLCLSNYLRSFELSTLNLEKQLNYYLSQIQPLNEKVRLSAKFAALRRPQASANDTLISLLINEEDKALKKCQASSDSLPRDMFWKPASPTGTSNTTTPIELSNQKFNPM